MNFTKKLNAHNAPIINKINTFFFDWIRFEGSPENKYSIRPVETCKNKLVRVLLYMVNSPGKKNKKLPIEIKQNKKKKFLKKLSPLKFVFNHL